MSDAFQIVCQFLYCLYWESVLNTLSFFDGGDGYVEDMEAIDIPDHLLPYFDYEAYGRDVRINEDGHFAPGGYVLNNGGKFIEHYHGIEDIPAEHKVFAFPQLSVREQMAAYKEIIDGSALEGYRKIAKKEHEER